VPYPAELVHDKFVLLKDYRLNDYPGKAAGCLDESVDYFPWLADYLYECTVELTPEQRYFQAYDTEHNFGAYMLGHVAGICQSSVCSYYEFPDDFAKNPDITRALGKVDDPYAEYLESWPGDEPLMSKEEFVINEYGYHLTKLRDEALFALYWPDFVELEPMHWVLGIKEPKIEPADAAWRVHLSCILKNIPDKAARRKELESFYNEYWDTMNK
jgi:hypothetical protein